MSDVNQGDDFHRSEFFKVKRIITLDCQLHLNQKGSGNKTKIIRQQQLVK